MSSSELRGEEVERLAREALERPVTRLGEPSPHTGSFWTEHEVDLLTGEHEAECFACEKIQRTREPLLASEVIRLRAWLEWMRGDPKGACCGPAYYEVCACNSCEALRGEPAPTEPYIVSAPEATT